MSGHNSNTVTTIIQSLCTKTGSNIRWGVEYEHGEMYAMTNDQILLLRQYLLFGLGGATEFSAT